MEEGQEVREGEYVQSEHGHRHFATLEHSLHHINPPQSRGEKCRDSIIDMLDAPFFQCLGIFVLFWVITDGAFFFFLLMGWHAMCEPKDDCDPRNWWLNFSIQFLNVLFTYMATVSMTWRCTNLLHLLGWSCPNRAHSEGLDLYGCPTEQIWFHIPRRARIVIMVQLLGNCIAQYINQITRAIFWTYDESDVYPGVLWTNLFFALSFLLAATGGACVVWQEHKLRKAQPDRFGPGPVDIIKGFLCKDKNKQEEEEEEEPSSALDQEALSPEQDQGGDEEERDSGLNRFPDVTPFDRNAMRLFAL